MSEEVETSPSEEFLRAAACAPPVEPPVPEPDLIGQAVGRFRVMSRLGQGGMGIVYRAKDSVLGREVALKVLPQEVMRDAGRRRRFLKEARLAAAINHPNLVAIYDVGEEAERIYLAMELVDGQPLRDKLASGPMELGEVLRIGAEMARGVARAHAAGIVHRDLKPENVMVASDGTVKILDFGIATIRTSGVDGTTPTESGGGESDLGVVVGTPSYMSPEQAKLRELTDKSDCFALGVVLYEMLTAKRPFTGTNAFEIVIAIDRDAPEPLDVARPGIPRSLADVVSRCLEKDPHARPAAAAIARALAAIDLGAARSVSVAAPPRPSPNPRYVWAAAVVALGGGVAFALTRGSAPATSGSSSSTMSLRVEPPAGAEPTRAGATAPTSAVSPLASTAAAPSASASGSASAAATTPASAAAATSASAARSGKSAVPTASTATPSSTAPAASSPAPSATSKRDPLADPI